MASSRNSIGVKLISKGIDPEVDIIAVHGLHGDAYKTWTAKPESKGESEVLWLRDLLPAEVPNARILSYGYDSDPGKIFESTSTNMVHHHATTLVSELHFYRRREHERRRPIIFVCHSLGGIVVKRALIYSSTCNLSHNVHLRSIKVSTYGILFLGTPHLGADLARWGKMAEMLVRAVSPKSWVDLNNALIKTLEKNSETLQNITDSFLAIQRDFKLFFFWEELKTSIPGIGRELIVEFSSAVPEALPDAGRAAIHATHSDMCKFRDENSPGWNILVGCLYDFCKQAPRVIERSWAQEQRRNMQATEDFVTNMLHNTDGGFYHLSNSRTSSPSGTRRITERGDPIQPDEISEFGIDPYESRNPSHNHLLIKNTPHFDIPAPIAKPLSLQENKYFEGREDDLDQIHTILLDPQKKSKKRAGSVCISSVAGGGKTHLVREYFFHRKSEFPGGRFWIDCNPMKSTFSTESLDLGFCMIAEQLGLADQQPPSGPKNPRKKVDPKVTTRLAVLKWFEQNVDWLLVLDGVSVETNDELNTLSEYVPKSKGGSTIFTTLNSAFAGSARLGSPEPLRLKQVTGNQAVEMVLQYAQIKSPSQTELEAAKELVEDLERNPLAIQSAGSYIRGKKISISAYWKKYEKRPFVEREFLEPFHLIFDRLDERPDRYGEARNLLYLITFLHQEIPVQMLDFGMRHLPRDIKLLSTVGSRTDLNNTIGHLLSYSLVDRSGSQADNIQIDTLVLHSVVQDVCISRLRRKSGQLKRWLELSIRLYCSSFDATESRYQNSRFLVSDYRRYELHGVRLLEHAKKFKVATGDLDKVLARLTDAINADDQADGPRLSMFAGSSGSDSAPETPSVSPESTMPPPWDIKREHLVFTEPPPTKRPRSLARMLKEKKEEWSQLEDTEYDSDTEQLERPPRGRRHRPKLQPGGEPYKFRYEPPGSLWKIKDGKVALSPKAVDSSQLTIEDATHHHSLGSGADSQHSIAGTEDSIESTSRRSLRALLRTPSGFSSLDPNLPQPRWPWNFSSPRRQSPLRSVSPTPSDMQSRKNSLTSPKPGDTSTGSFSRGRSPIRRTRASIESIPHTTAGFQQNPFTQSAITDSDDYLFNGSGGGASYPPKLRRQSTPVNYPGQTGIRMPDKPTYSEIVSNPKPFSPGYSPSRDPSNSPIANSIVGPRYDRPSSGAWSEPILAHDGDFSLPNSPSGGLRARSTATGGKSPRLAELQASGWGGGPSGTLAPAMQRVVSEPWSTPRKGAQLSQSSPGLGIGNIHFAFGSVPQVTIHTPDHPVFESFGDGISSGGDGLLAGGEGRSERRSSVPENIPETESTAMQRSVSEPDYVTGYGLQQIRRRSPSRASKIHKD